MSASPYLPVEDVCARKQLGQPLRGNPGSVFRDTGSIYSVAFSPGARTLASGGADTMVRLWEGILWSNFNDLRTQVCSLVATPLTKAEWTELAPGINYRQTC